MKKSAITIFLLILGLACLWGASRVHRSLLEQRINRSADEATSLDQSPPLVVFTTVAIGGFRGMIADLLWMRIIRLQEEGKVFEMVQLSDWITKLEPHFVTVWAFNAWNMAYNISLLFPDPDDRWRWVNSGICLLRDESLKYNPRSSALRRELGWLYQHKIGFYMDQAHLVYKWKLVEEMADLFDGPRPDYRAAPNSSSLLRLKRDYKLDPVVMEEIDREYGPLDWRLPATHAVYWAFSGLQVASGKKGDLACEHMLSQCMAESFRHGRLILNPRSGLYLATPDLDLLPNVLKAYGEALSRHPEAMVLKVSYVNFLAEASVIMFAYDRLAEARDLYQRMLLQVPEVKDTGFEDFILHSLSVGIPNPPLRDAVPLVEGFLVQHYTWMALGDEARSTAFENLARQVWTLLLESSPSPERWQNAGLAPLQDMRRQALARAIAEAPSADVANRLLAFASNAATGMSAPAE